MKQLNAINKILPFVIEDKAVQAVFLKGSIARDESDEFSDIDFYCMVKEEELDSFLIRRLDYMKQYKPLIFHQEVNFVGPQIVGVYNNGLHFDLYTVTYETLKRTDEIKVLYDPEDLLTQYKAEKLTIDENDLLENFNEISFVLLEFEVAYCRNDLIWASRLGSHIVGYLAIILRWLYDSDNAQLGLKRLYKKMDNNMLDRLSKAMDLLGPSSVLQGINQLIKIVDEVIEMLPKNISDRVNKKFFDFMVERIISL